MSVHGQASPRTQGNLTGSARVLNDIVVNFYNAIQKWKSCLVDGVNVIQDIQQHIENADVVEKKCQEMGKLLSDMRSYIVTMKEYEQKLENLSILNKGVPSISFTWSYSRIVEAVKIICQAYSKEMDFRVKIGSSLHKKTFKQLNVIAIFWLHCGQVDCHVETYFEALLRECSLKS